MTPTPLRDHVFLIDGALEGTVLCLSETPPEVIEFEVAVDSSGRVVAIDDDPMPAGLPPGNSHRYRRVDADDGCWSRDDDGHLLMSADEA